MDDLTQKFIDHVRGVLEGATATFAELWESERWDSITEIVANLKTLYRLAQKVVAVSITIQQTCWEEFKDLDDSEIIDRLAEMLDDMIKLPVLLELFDRYVIGICLEAGWNYVWRVMDVHQPDEDLEIEQIVQGVQHRLNQQPEPAA